MMMTTTDRETFPFEGLALPYTPCYRFGMLKVAGMLLVMMVTSCDTSQSGCVSACGGGRTSCFYDSESPEERGRCLDIYEKCIEGCSKAESGK